MLKKGAIFGGALVWATPVVQTVGMRAASAQEASPACNVWYAVKLGETLEEPFWECSDRTLAEDGAGGNCLSVGGLKTELETTFSTGGCDHIVSVTKLDDEGETTDVDAKVWKIVLDEDCRFVHGSERCTVKAGADKAGGGCFEDVCIWDFATRTLTFTSPVTLGISHVEFAFCCND